MGDMPAVFTAFEGLRLVATGPLPEVARRVKGVLEEKGHETVLIFADATGQQVEFDFRGTVDEVERRLRDAAGGEAVDVATPPASGANRGPGRPKLGVVAREVTLLPRHWDWLNRQPGGASVALRKLVDQARHAHEANDRVRKTQEATYRVMSALAGNLPGYEEALRALFALDAPGFAARLDAWPDDVRAYLNRLAPEALRPPVGP